MASVFRHQYRNPAGQLAPVARWRVQFVDWSDSTRARGLPRKLPGFDHRAASLELGHKLERLSRLRAAREPVDAELARYIDRLPVRIREKLARWGLLHPAAAAALRPLAETVTLYEQALRDGVASRKQRGRPATTAYILKTGNRIRTLLGLMDARGFADITPATVMRALRTLQAKGIRRKGIGSKSAAHYYGALWSFLAWAQRAKLIPANPLADAARPDGAAEPRHPRRILELPELLRLLQAARNGAERFGVDGESRYWLYRLAAETGFRASELRSLTRASVRLDGSPSATVAASFSKNRRARSVPLKLETAAELRDFIGAKLPTAPLFKMPRPENIVIMLRGDLATARAAWLAEAPAVERVELEKTDFLQYLDSSGRYADFHSLRGVFATHLIATGADVKTAQELLGHTTSKMTLDTYAKVQQGAKQNAITQLPNLARPQQQAATGTYGGQKGVDNHINTGAETGAFTSQNHTTGGIVIHQPATMQLSLWTEKNPINTGENSASDCRKMNDQEGNLQRYKTPPRGFEPLSPA